MKSPDLWRCLAPVVLLLISGCVTPPEIPSASLSDVQDQAWGEVKDLQATLDRVDADRHPGIAAVADDLAAMIDDVEAPGGPHYDRIDLAGVVAENPDYWRALLELDPDDPTLLALETLLVAAAGRPWAAERMLDFMRAGPLPDEELDEKLVLLRRVIELWHNNPVARRMIETRNLPPDQRWIPTKQALQQFPDSVAAALAVLLMRSELAGVDLFGEEEDLRMRDKVVAAEPEAMDTLRRQAPLLAAILEADGETRDAARRIYDMITHEDGQTVVLDEEDYAQLAADLVRLGLPHWALRAARLQMARRGEARPSDIEAWRALLPELIGEEATEALVEAWHEGQVRSTRIHGSVAEPTEVDGRPAHMLWVGMSERDLRDVTLGEEQTLPSRQEQEDRLVREINAALALGRYEQARQALDHLTLLTDKPKLVDLMRLQVEVQSGNVAAVPPALEAVYKVDRRMRLIYGVIAEAEALMGDWEAAADAYAKGFANKQLDVRKRGFAALHAHGAARIAGGEREKLMRRALEFVPQHYWIHQLLLASLGEIDREQLLADAAEGSHSEVVGQRCEAYFALAFASGQTFDGRRADLEACVETGAITYVEYQLARHYLAQQ